MRELRKLLYRFGIYKTQEGYEPLLVAVELILEDPERLSCLSRRLYPTVAVLCKSNPRTVERNMRYCVARAWGPTRSVFPAGTAPDLSGPDHRRLPMYVT
ncbi:MAG: sporulation initiation factor Spo0A C-terminal domain-containing protein [Oscillospiraceae bacterium]